MPAWAWGELKYQFIRTPLEAPLLKLKELAGWPRRLRHPELAPIWAEDRLIQEVLDRAVRPGTNAVDVGAHYGTMLSAILRRSPDGRHVAFEAMPDKTRFLRRRFPEVEVHECALGAEPGTIEFFVNEKRSGFSSMARHGDEGDRFRQITVERRTLDRLLADGPPVHFLKVDVEGAEEQVFRGGRAFLEKHGPLILFECGPSGAAAFGAEPVGVFDVLAELDYDVFLLDAWLADGVPIGREDFQQALVYPFRAFNWVAQTGR